jgi:hypothetical protein
MKEETFADESPVVVKNDVTGAKKPALPSSWAVLKMPPPWNSISHEGFELRPSPE